MWFLMHYVLTNRIDPIAVVTSLYHLISLSDIVVHKSFASFILSLLHGQSAPLQFFFFLTLKKIKTITSYIKCLLEHFNSAHSFVCSNR